MHEALVTRAAKAEPPELTDESIVASVLSGDRAAFELLMRRHNPRVFRTVRAILRDEDDAEDAMQQTYIAAYTHLSDFGGRAQFSTWLVRIAVHEALSRLRRSKRFTSLDDDDASDEEEAVASARDPEEAASDIELRATIGKAVETLPHAFRAVFVMRAVSEMSSTETAAALGIAEQTVRTRLHRARALLRKELGR